MSKKTREFLDQLKEGEPSMGAIEAIKEGIQTIAPGLSLSKILADVGDELSHLGKQGAHELAAGMFRGYDGFVMYPHQGQEDPQQGLPIEGMKPPEVEQDHGREM
ncbi:hypothetical protein [Fimbriiglobus ruber]|uniref:Uncharacterized protein n=1 Tax=Fimbriiglobus ruber TaxID=1908690 RepID=A0A225DKU1_9BACT|nr:hypothetical protein [Fimbriiglobus ruber]OWK42100.1 hypothetical protein FRUB_04178 [Fimbriiglobus ruber]